MTPHLPLFTQNCHFSDFIDHYPKRKNISVNTLKQQLNTDNIPKQKNSVLFNFSTTTKQTLKNTTAKLSRIPFFEEHWPPSWLIFSNIHVVACIAPIAHKFLVYLPYCPIRAYVCKRKNFFQVFTI